MYRRKEKSLPVGEKETVFGRHEVGMHLVLLIPLLILLAACGGTAEDITAAPDLQATIDYLETRNAFTTPIPDDQPSRETTAVPTSAVPTKTIESEEADPRTTILSPGETWYKDDVEITLSNPTYDPGCDGLFGFELDITNNNDEPIPPFKVDHIAVFDANDERPFTVWWTDGEATAECYPKSLVELQRPVTSGTSAKIAFRVMGDPDDRVSKVRVAIPRVNFYSAVWDVSGLEAQHALIAETEHTPEPIMTQSSAIQPLPLGVLWTSGQDDTAFVGNTAVVKQSNLLKAVELDSGNILWETDFAGRLVGADWEFVYLTPSDRRLDTVDIQTGDRVWTSILPKVSEMAFSWSTKDTIAVPAEGNAWKFLEKSSGHEFSETSLSVIHATEEVFVQYSDDTDRLSASSSEDPVLWVITSVSRPTSCGNSIIYFDNENNLVAIDVSNGEKMWEITAVDGILPYCGERQGPNLIYTYDSRNWSNRLLGVEPGYSTPSVEIAILGPSVDYDSFSVNLAPVTGIHLQTGQKLWTGPVSYPGFDRHDPSDSITFWLGVEGGLVIYSHTGLFQTTAFDLVTHDFLWTNDQIVLHRLLGATDEVLLGSVMTSRFDGTENIVALNLRTGETHWVVETSGVYDFGIANGKFVYQPEVNVGPELRIIDIQTGVTQDPIKLRGEGQIIFNKAKITAVRDLIVTHHAYKYITVVRP